ncbi:hypothetical protein LP415_04805 [Polaromonas sp. P1(28)-8]|nr:hypothetical protein LP415_04805 [Polaromonas sp. P1(28)-8]
MSLAIRDEVKALAALALAVWLACCGPARASAPAQAMWVGVVTYVVDGDTVWVRPADGGKPVSVRVDGIDAPRNLPAGRWHFPAMRSSGGPWASASRFSAGATTITVGCWPGWN